MADTNRALPGGSWTHSFEEDEAGVEVYRPTDAFPFPPGRKGREVLRFATGDDGEPAVTSLLPGPDDRPRAAPAATLRALGGGRYAWGADKELEIVEATPGILKLVRRHGGGARNL